MTAVNAPAPASGPAAAAATSAAPSAGSGGALHWTGCRFAELDVDNLYDALALRCRVFVLEQGPYLDPDGLDRHAWHLLGRDERGTLQAYLRVVDPGMKYVEPSIGRVIVAPEVRGTGLGRALFARGVEHCESTWPGRGIRISAQAHLARLYGGYGFVTVGEPYLEDDIPHVEMLRAP